jgi:hypothetical protein
VATALQLLAAIVRSSLIATLAAEAATTEAPTMGPTEGPVAEAIAAADATRIATPPESAHPPAGQKVMMINVDWRQPFIDYLSEQKVPSDKNLAEQLIRRAKSYVLVGDKLYRWGTSSGVLMKCVPRQEGKDILEEIHKGVCGNHASSRTLVSKAFRRAFHWPIALGDTEELVRSCQVPRVPIFRQATTRLGLQASHHTANLAFHLLGARHDWATSNCAGWIQPSIGGHRQVHQVDRGQAGYIPQG